MTRAQQLIQEILTLPVDERVEVVEAVVHDLADASTGRARSKARRRRLSPIGWLADRPEAADAILWSGTEGRADGKMRSFDDEDPR